MIDHRETIGSPSALACAQVGLAFAGVVAVALLRQWHFTINLPSADPALGSVVVDVATSQGGLAPAVVALGLLSSLALRHIEWADEGLPRAIRPIALTCSAALTLSFVLMPSNDFYEGGGLLDRALVLFTFMAVSWRPAFVPFATTIPYMMATQLQLPIGSYSFTDKAVVFETLWVCQGLLLAWIFLSPWLRRRDLRTEDCGERLADAAIVVASLPLVAWFIGAAIEKVRLGWPVEEDLSNLLVSAHLEGWLRGMPTDTILEIADAIRTMSIPLALAVLVIEFGALALVLRPRIGRYVLAALVVLHVAVFASTGIMFWKWVAVEIALALSLRGRRLRLSFSWRAVAAFLALGLVLLLPSRLGWLDSPLTERYDFVVVGQSGAQYPVPERWFAPYDTTIAQGRFGYLAASPSLVGTFGMHPMDLPRDAFDGLDVEEVQRLILRDGEIRHDERRSAAFDALVRRLCGGWGHRQMPLPWPLPPPHIWTTDPSGVTSPGEPLERLVVERVDLLRLEGEVEVVDRQVVHEVPLAGSSCDGGRS